MDLVIVESPAKAKTIEKFLGKGFTVKSSFGHVRDLSSKGISIKIDSAFEPEYEVMPDKKKVISELQSLAKKSNTVWLATDEDREGEAISWHLFDVLKLKDEATKRIVFNEITKAAIDRAVNNPRKINKNLVDAQQARRILDRLVGYELSPVLWKKIKPSLSAGRVQSVTVRLIVERENEIKNFEAADSFKTEATFILSDGKTQLKANLNRKLKDSNEANEFLEKCKTADFSIGNLEVKPGKRTPSPPFTTSTLQQEASRKLGFSVTQTMVVAQKLYESGKITYMRTDSVNLSNLAVNTAKEVINQTYGPEFSKPRKYATKTKGAQEAHEAIRPTYLDQPSIEGERNEVKLYDLIYKRTLASQMAEAKLEKTEITIEANQLKDNFIASGEVVVFEGFMKVYMESTDDDESEKESSGLLPKVKIGEALALNSAFSTQKFTTPPPRYTEASLVRKLEALGIGRPSTYAPTISTVQKRGYVVKEDRAGIERQYLLLSLKSNKIKQETKTEIIGKEKSKLFPTDIGIVVNDFLVENFEKIMDYGFTAKVEEEFDVIAEGKRKWQSMIEEFYTPFHENVESTLENSGRATGETLLGQDPKTGKNVYAKIGKYGPLVQIGETDDEEKPRFAGIKGNISITDITLEQALEFFQLPKTLGEFEGEEVAVGVGRFGPYVRHKGKFVSISKDSNPTELSLKEAISLIEDKRVDDANKYINEFQIDNELVQVLNGRFGPYIKKGRKNFKIPKGKNPTELNIDDCKEIIAQAAKPKAAKKTTKSKG